MESRYLYRGKRIDNGKWVEGSLVTGVFFRLGQEIPYMFCPNLADYDCFEDFSEENGIFEVDPSTICQCTGRTDRDKALIFEHDVVAYLDTYSTENGYAEADCVGEVVWDEETLSFQVTNRLSAESWEVIDGECKVLGNTIDNPELLE